MRGFAVLRALPIGAILAACTSQMGAGPSGAQGAIPAGAAEAQARLAASPRHGEWAMVDAGAGDSVRAWVVYPERRDRAPVVVVVHEIYGLTHWIRGVADQLAADGFIAIAPDLMTEKHLPVGPDGDPVRDSATAAIRTLDPAAVQRRLDAAARYAMALPAALPRYGIVGFCWGGGVSFAHAAHAPGLGASVVYYGVSPPREALANVRAPVLGLYGENDARVDATIAPADSALRALGRTYQHQVFPGAGHGFLRQQDGQNGANLQAARAAWPRTVQWFHRWLRG
jgi:carboxymethylenebutenolidase